MDTYRITAQVLNGATGEVREVVAKVKASDEQGAVNALFARARRDDYAYRFLGEHGVMPPTTSDAAITLIKYENQEYWARG